MTNTSQALPSHSARILSVDIFRGLTMLVMIFVNDIASVKGLPWWNYHIPPGANGMTYVDVVFPAFLFIVGMAIPLAIQSRLDKGDSIPGLWAHILLRSASLVVLGLFIANSMKLDSQLTGISGRVWGPLGFVAAILLWNVYPKSGRNPRLYQGLKYAGLILLAGLFVGFRRRLPDGTAGWLDFSYWEILGLIGRAYLAVCLLYVPFRKTKWAPACLLVGLCTLNVLSRLGLEPLLHRLPYPLWVFDNGAHPSIVMAGVVASIIFLDPAFAKTFREKALWALGYAAILGGAGYALSPFGIAKNAATPTWCLYCAAISTLLFLALYGLVDVKKVNAWAAPLKPAGSNTLLTYLLPDIIYVALGGYYFKILTEGLPGVFRGICFTACILGLSALLTRWKIRMQL